MDEECSTFDGAVKCLAKALGPDSQILAAQDFHHTIQEEQETVSSFIRRLEKAFRLAYGEDNLKLDTRHTFLYGQLQEGLQHSLVRSPSASGALNYKEICMAAKNEERRQIEVKKCQQYLVRKALPTGTSGQKAPLLHNDSSASNTRKKFPHRETSVRCYNCNKLYKSLFMKLSSIED